MFPYRDEIVLQLTRKMVASHPMAATKYPRSGPRLVINQRHGGTCKAANEEMVNIENSS